MTNRSSWRPGRRSEGEAKAAGPGSRGDSDAPSEPPDRTSVRLIDRPETIDAHHVGSYSPGQRPPCLGR
jgi:hypothetical protein